MAEHILCFIASVTVAVVISVSVTTAMCKKCIDYSTERAKDTLQFCTENIVKYIKKG